MTVSLPKGETNVGANNWSDVYGNDKALKEATETLEGKFPVTTANLSQSKLTWYTPKIIATEESRTNTEYGTLTTKDEITEVVVPTNGKLAVSFRAHVKQSVGGAGRVAFFIGANQLKNTVGGASEGTLAGTVFNTFYSAGSAFTTSETEAADATTGQIIHTGPFEIFLAAGTYAVSVQYKSTSGSMTAKERKLWVAVYG